MGNFRKHSPRVFWSEAEVNILMEHYPSLSAAELLEKLPGRTIRVIQCKANGLGLSRTKPKKRTAEQTREAKRKHILKRRREGAIKPGETRELWDEAEYANFDGEYQELCQLVFGPEWWFNLSKEDNPDYIYLGKIVDTVKAAFSLEELQQGKLG